jgi:rhodanese-related sulfurtransferase
LSSKIVIQERTQNNSRVLDIPAAEPKTSAEHFLSKLALETDPSDVYADLMNKVPGFLLVDARTPEAYAKGHVPSAINLPHRKIDAQMTSMIPKDKILITYCDGVFCNASTKAAAKLTALGFRVKEMLDGLSGWKTEGYPVEETILQLSAQASKPQY